MGADLSKVSMLTRREIEACIAGPLIRAFILRTGYAKKSESRCPSSLSRLGGAIHL